jgi:prefoldin subunit 5
MIIHVYRVFIIYREDTKNIYVSVGYGFHLQLTLDEALKFIDKKQVLMEK